MRKLLVFALLMSGMVLAQSTPTTANVWVNTVAGASPSRCSSPCAYVAANAYGTIQNAWTAASAGDTIVIKASTRAGETISGNKASDTTIWGEATTTLGNMVGNAAHMVLRNVTIDVGTTAINQGFDAGANFVSLYNVKLHGNFVHLDVSSDDFLWDGGEFNCSGCTAGRRDFCTSQLEPILFWGANRPTLRNLNLYPNDTVGGACGHLEYIRVDNGGSNLTLDRITLQTGDNSNSAFLFITNIITNPASYSGLTVKNSRFAATPAFFLIATNDPVITSMTNWTIAYNTALQTLFHTTASTTTGSRFIGNLAPDSGDCVGTHTKNVWQTGSCTSGSDITTASLGLSGFDILTTSAAKEAGEVPSPSDYCTDAAGLNSVDFYGNTRPAGANCDAGAMEFAASGSGSGSFSPSMAATATMTVATVGGSTAYSFAPSISVTAAAATLRKTAFTRSVDIAEVMTPDTVADYLSITKSRFKYHGRR
jgi:hypothetical protein